MQRRRGIISAVVAAVQLCVLGAVLALAHGGAHAGAAGSIAITGTVSSQSGAGIAAVSVYATAPGGSSAEFGPTSTAADGTYTLYVDAGTYDFHFDPAGGSGLTPVVDSNVTVLSDQTINAQLVPPTHTFSGTVTDQNGNPIAGLGLNISNSQFGYHTTTDSNGHYSFVVTSAVYNSLNMQLNYGGGYLQLGASALTEDLSGSDVTQNFTLSFAKLSIAVKDAAGNPVPNAPVSEVGYANGDTAAVASGGAALPFNVYIDANETADSTGTAQVLAPVGTYFGTGYIDAGFPDGTTATNGTAVTLSSDMSVEIDHPVTHTFSGTVTDQNGNPLSNVSVVMGSGNTHTDAAGAFSMTLPAGSYTGLLLEPPYSSGYSTVQNNNLTENLTSSDVTQHFAIAMATLTVATEDAAGNPAPGASVSEAGYANGDTAAVVVDGTAMPFNIYVDTSEASDSSGIATVRVPLGTYFGAGSIGAGFADGAVASNSTAVTMNGDERVVITHPIIRTFSGTVTDQNGNPIAGLGVSLTNPNDYTAKTDASGHFSVAVTAAIYTGLTLSPTYTNGASGYALFTDDSMREDLSGGDVTQNFTLNLAKLSIVIKDGTGNPAAGMGASEVGNGSTSVTSGGTSYPFSVYVDASETTDSSGTGSIFVPVGTYFGTGFIDAQFPDGTLTNNSTAFTMNKAVSVIFQEGEPVVEPPAAPADLTAPSPVQTPTLAWNAANGATSYNIYRNGIEVAATAATTYTDTAAPEGTQTYYVTAANNDGESNPSNTINVVVDRTPPTITYTLSPTPDANGWNNTSVTVSFTCSDALAGIASCPAPQTITAEGRNQSLSATATDKAGNAASVTVSGINIDETAPAVSGASMSSTLILFSGRVTVSANAADNLSGVTGGEFYIDTDPGAGNGTPMAYANSKLTATSTISGLRAGRHTLYIRAQDAAGNWSATTSITFTFV